MKGKLKKVMAVLLIVIIVVGWYAAIAGLGPVKPLKDKMQLGLDIKGGVYVVLEAQDVEKYDAAELRKLKLLKAQGYNAIRCSHNMSSENLLYLCDSLGLMVIDEAFGELPGFPRRHDRDP